MNSPALAGKNIIVTGASRGLGRSLALKLSAAGANLLLVARSETGLVETRLMLTGPAAILTADLADAVAGIQIAEKARTLWPQIHGVVNNAATVGPIGKLWETDPAEWEAALRINLIAPLNLCRATIPWLIESGSGSIVNLSGGGATAPRPRFTAYAAAKAAIVRLTETLAEELEGTGVRCNAIAPGAMNTEMLEAVLQAGPEAAGGEYQKAVEQREKGGSSPDRAAELCAFLLSDAAREISGRLLSAVWDPWATLPRRAAELGDIYTLRRIVPADRGKEWETA